MTEGSGGDAKKLISLVRMAAQWLPWVRAARRRRKVRKLQGKEISQVFENKHREKQARKDSGALDSASGPGSGLAETARIREALPNLLREHGVKSMLDLPCGDFFWMKEVDLGDVDYAGADIAPALIEANQQYRDERIRF